MDCFKGFKAVFVTFILIQSCRLYGWLHYAYCLLSYRLPDQMKEKSGIIMLIEQPHKICWKVNITLKHVVKLKTLANVESDFQQDSFLAAPRTLIWI